MSGKKQVVVVNCCKSLKCYVTYGIPRWPVVWAYASYYLRK